MICECGLLVKKRTIIDGIKSLLGSLVVFIVKSPYDQTYYIKKCCFITLLPSMYTFIDKSWLTYSDIVIFDPKSVQARNDELNVMGSERVVLSVFKLSKDILDRIISYGGADFKIKYIESARLIVSEYDRVSNNLNMAFQKVVNLEQLLNELRYKYMTHSHVGNTIVNQKINSDSEEQSIPSPCHMCSNTKEIKQKLKDIKKTTYEQIDKIQYELDISLKRVNELQIENAKLKEENTKLKDINDSLYMNR